MEAIQFIQIDPKEYIEAIAKRVTELMQPTQLEVWIPANVACKITGKSAPTIVSYSQKGLIKVQRNEKTNPNYLLSDVLKYIKH